ncbi:DUF4968 domain-containing protein [Lactococcus lactis]|nr:DUF4968 domain-containing protein [Lactococcus lactis]
MNNNIIKFDKARFTVLTEQLIRIEYSHTGEFEDGMTQMIQNRDFPEVKFDFIKKKVHLKSSLQQFIFIIVAESLQMQVYLLM